MEEREREAEKLKSVCVVCVGERLYVWGRESACVVCLYVRESETERQRSERERQCVCVCDVHYFKYTTVLTYNVLTY